MKTLSFSRPDDVNMVRIVLVNEKTFKLIAEISEKTFDTMNEGAILSETPTLDHVFRMAARRYRSARSRMESRKSKKSSVFSIHPFQ